MALRPLSRADLLALTPDRYLAHGFADPEALAGEYATAAATQLLDADVAPQELAFTAAALDETIPLHGGDPRDQAEAAVHEALGIVRRLIRQPNNERLAQWLEQCAEHVSQPTDLPALQAHLDAVLKQYSVIAAFSPGLALLLATLPAGAASVSAQPLQLLVDRAVLDATSPAARAAVEQWSEKQRSPAIPDEFNPAVIDIHKFDAFVAALPPDAATTIGPRPMALDPRRLGIGTSSPTTPASFKPPLALHVVQQHTDSVSVSAAFTVDCDLARARANAARALTRDAEAAVRAAEARHDSGTAARVRRWAVARVWEENAIAAAACTPGDAELVDDSQAATKATDAAILLGGSMQ